MKADRIKIYDEHDQAFQHISAYVVLHRGERVATIAFKRARSNLRTTCFLHWHGLRMVKGTANGGGYDKANASAAHAANKMVMPPHDGNDAEALRDFLLAVREDGGLSWAQALERAGFQVLQAV